MNILIRADATAMIGTGHVMRCIALGAYCVSKSDTVQLVSAALHEDLVAAAHRHGIHVSTNCAPGPQAQPHTEFLRYVSTVSPDWVVLDGYWCDTQLQSSVKKVAPRVLSIDDTAQGLFTSDVVVNQNLHASDLFSYSAIDSTKLLLGTDYVLLRPEFLEHREKRQYHKNGQRVLVSMGGSDPENHTLKVLRSLTHCRKQIECQVILGSYNQHAASMTRISRELPFSCNILQSPADIPSLMRWCDLAVVAAGSIVWELAALKTPMITLAWADNQIPITSALGRSGAAYDIGHVHRLQEHELAVGVDSLLSNPVARENLGTVAGRLVDGRGCERVHAAMREMMK